MVLVVEVMKYVEELKSTDMILLCSTYHLPLLSLQRSSVSGDLSLCASQLFGLLFNDICDRMGQRKHAIKPSGKSSYSSLI